MRWMLAHRSKGFVMDLGAQFKGKYFDGKSAQQFCVTVTLEARNNTSALVIERDGDAKIIWPLAELREVQEQARSEGIVLSLGQNGISRLILLEASAEQIVRDKAPNLGKVIVKKSKLLQLVIWSSGALASVFLIMFVILPALSNQLATMIPVEREVALGELSINQIHGFLGGSEENDLTCSNAQGLLALQKMAKRIVGNIELPYELKVKVFDHEMINAFAVPGGQVVLFDGLLKAADSPEEIASVLGHEVGHVANRDPMRLTLRSAGSIGILGLVFGDFAGGFMALALTERLISAKYSQRAETGADAFAHQLMADANLPSAAFATFFQKLKRAHGGQSTFMSHLASHPNLDGRAIAAAAADIVGESDYEPVLTTHEWYALQNICD
jgi:Zn-dependent protease with chaperone function